MTDTEVLAVTRSRYATWVIPSEDEWCKAAYHKTSGANDYYYYPTSTNSEPSNDLIDPDPGNNATFRITLEDYTIGSPYWRTEVGAHENSDSPYGTFDQGGNVMEWTEGIIYDSKRVLRGGSWASLFATLSCLERYFAYAPTDDVLWIGFRVAEVPAPAPVPADLDADGDADLYDFALLQADFGGNLDLHYFAWFQANFTGPLP